MLNAESVQQALAKMAHPEVVEYRVRVGEDWSGDPAVFVGVVGRDAESLRAVHRQIAEDVREAVASLSGGEGSWTYVTFRTAEEMAELQEEAAAEGWTERWP